MLEPHPSSYNLTVTIGYNFCGFSFFVVQALHASSAQSIATYQSHVAILNAKQNHRTTFKLASVKPPADIVRWLLLNQIKIIELQILPSPATFVLQKNLMEKFAHKGW